MYLKGKRLVDAKTLSSTPLSKSDILASHLSTVHQSNNEYYKLLSTVPQIMKPQVATLPTKHGVEHFINTTGLPISVRDRRLSLDKLNFAKAQFNRMEKMGIIRRSNSPWTSPLHMVWKASGEWCPCRDYQHVTDRYLVLHIQDISAHLEGTTIFSKIDLVKGYHQVPVASDDLLYPKWL